MRKYSYNTEMGVLYKQIISSDGIGKQQLNFHFVPFDNMSKFLNDKCVIYQIMY